MFSTFQDAIDWWTANADQILYYVTCERLHHLKWNATKDLLLTFFVSKTNKVFRNFINEKTAYEFIGPVADANRSNFRWTNHNGINKPTSDWRAFVRRKKKLLSMMRYDVEWDGLDLFMHAKEPKKWLAKSHGPWHNSVISSSNVHPLQMHSFLALPLSPSTLARSEKATSQGHAARERAENKCVTSIRECVT